MPLRTVGSLTLVRSLFGLNLVDRLRLAVFPLVLGPDGREPWYAGHRAGPTVTRPGVMCQGHRFARMPVWQR